MLLGWVYTLVYLSGGYIHWCVSQVGITPVMLLGWV